MRHYFQNGQRAVENAERYPLGNGGHFHGGVGGGGSSCGISTKKGERELGEICGHNQAPNMRRAGELCSHPAGQTEIIGTTSRNPARKFSLPES